MQESHDILIKQRLAYCLGKNCLDDEQYETIFDYLHHYYTKVLGMSEDDAIDVIFGV